MCLVPPLMLDIDGVCLNDEDKQILQNPYVAGMILFARNITSPEQVRSLCDEMKSINPNIVIAADQEGGRVARLKAGFSRLPAMGAIGKLFDDNENDGKLAAYGAGYVMASEVLAVGIDFSFAPVLDIDNGSRVIGDRAFHRCVATTSLLAQAFIDGMNDAGMKATGKHFPGHGSVLPDSHTDDAIDERSLDEIKLSDLKVFVDTMPKLSALMPAHVIFSQIDDKPAGFSSVWIDTILRGQYQFDGVLFSDDLSMKAAHIAGDMTDRARACLLAGCDVALICNDRKASLEVLDNVHRLPRLKRHRLKTMRGNIPTWQGDLNTTCTTHFADYQAQKQILARWFDLSWQ